MKVKKNNRFLAVSVSIVTVIIIILLAVFILFNSDIINSGYSFAGAANKLNSYPVSHIDVKHYDIDVELFAADKLIAGDVKIKFNLTEDVDDVVHLDFYDNFDIISLELNGKTVLYEYADNKISISKNDLTSKDNLFRIRYKGTPKSEGFGSFIFGEYGDKSFIYSLNEPVYASTWIPCNDVLTDKATLDISITNDSSMVSVSNGRLTGIDTKGSKKTYSYSTDYLISTYLIAIYSADYEQFSDDYVSQDRTDTMKINYFVTPDKLENAVTDFSIHPEAMSILADLYGEYPFIKDGYGVAQFLWKYGAMEHQTITGIGSDYISGFKFHTGMLVHEIAHHWWGNAVTPKSWKDIWLNEGFATYSEALYWEKKSGERSLQSTMRGYFNSFDQHKLYDPGLNLFSRLVYEKGAWVLHMLRRELGDTVFFKILRNYFEKYKYKNASTEDFINLCEMISGKELSYFFDQWLYDGVGILELDYRKTYSESNVILKISQVQKDTTVYNFLLDLELVYRDGQSEFVSHRVSSKDTTLQLPVLEKPERVILDPDDWLLASIFEISDEK